MSRRLIFATRPLAGVEFAWRVYPVVARSARTPGYRTCRLRRRRRSGLCHVDPAVFEGEGLVCATPILPFSKVAVQATANVAQTLLSVLSQDALADVANRGRAGYT